MSEMTREMEITTTRIPSPETLPGDVVFVENALTEVGHAMGRFMDPTPVASELLDRETVASDEKIAEILSRVKDDSPKIDPTTEQGVAEATANMIGRAESVIEQATDPVVKQGFERFKKTKTRGAASFLTKPFDSGRRKFVKALTLTGLTLIISACAPKIIGSVIIPGDGGGATRPTASESAPVMVPTETKEPTPTQTATPTEAPTPTEIPIQVGLPEKFEDVQVVNEEDLPTFMPRLLEAERKYLEEKSATHKQTLIFGPINRPSEGHYVLPYPAWTLTLGDKGPSIEPMTITSWTIIRMKDGSQMQLLGFQSDILFEGKAKYGFNQGDPPLILHYAYDAKALEASSRAAHSGSSDIFNKYNAPKVIFDQFKNGTEKDQSFHALLLIESQNPNNDSIISFGWQAAGTLLEKLDKEINYSQKLEDWMKKDIDPGQEFLKTLQSSALPITAPIIQ